MAPEIAKRPRLLIVEDDTELAALLAALITDEGYEVDLAHDAQQGLHLGLGRAYRVMVIDRRLPGMDGLELLGKLRRRAVTARVLILTALGSHAERVRGLDAGADDYLTKPFDFDELLARIRALDRRFGDQVDLLPLGEGFLDRDTRDVSLPNGTRVQLSQREFDLLRTLAARPRAVHSRPQLRAQVFPDTAADSVVDTYVYYLRRKLGRQIVQTVYGLGYRIGPL
ncbi:response regulator transcription factor [Actinospica sp.]|jgi:two-component system response regulator QseB|uniref:response regulator transcription factor n=1 Tax=Actinospica sp. TaxID=1872142 RepID=UPI002CEF5E4B|nr:response regulator transcription factor [Actinospica sp.]HWG22602.1 response regulator transcription factor [Actinospica sp.]